VNSLSLVEANSLGIAQFSDSFLSVGRIRRASQRTRIFWSLYLPKSALSFAEGEDDLRSIISYA